MSARMDSARRRGAKLFSELQAVMEQHNANVARAFEQAKAGGIINLSALMADRDEIEEQAWRARAAAAAYGTDDTEDPI